MPQPEQPICINVLSLSQAYLNFHQIQMMNWLVHISLKGGNLSIGLYAPLPSGKLMQSCLQGELNYYTSSVYLFRNLARGSL